MEVGQSPQLVNEEQKQWEAKQGLHPEGISSPAEDSEDMVALSDVLLVMIGLSC